MEIVGRNFGGSELERLKLSGLYGNDTILILYRSLDLQKRVMNDDRMITFKQLRPDDDVGDSRFVFKAEEHESFGRARTLSNDYRSDYFDWLAIRKMFQDSCRRNTQRVEFSAMVSKGMRAHSQASTAKIRKDALFGSHRV